MDQLTNGEINLLKFNRGMTGSFMRHLFEALFVADEHNLDRLAKGFPEEVEAVRRWGNESGYSDKIEKLWNK
jgi:hypothetical protein